MARRSRRRPYGQPHPELDTEAVRRGGARSETGRDGLTWSVRTVASGEKTYTCPGCRHPIPPGVRHVVAWSEDHLFGAQAGVAERRHWHTGCWRGRY
ncbi:MAG TPA: hypothetical protein VK095_02200 [Beutenbergiaceae bacterium]|nr:hypothetical protein [Beutenbergiaceae bacterium]